MNARHHRWSSGGLALLTGALLAGCGGDAGRDLDATSATAEPTGAAGAVELVGTWETEPIPPERLRAGYIEAGGSEQAAAEWVAEFEAERSVRFRIEVSEETWRLYEIGDDTAPVPGWTGTYTVDGSTVRARDTSAGCEIDYGVVLDGQSLSLTVLRHAGEGPDCGEGDFLVHKTVYELAPFTRAS